MLLVERTDKKPRPFDPKRLHAVRVPVRDGAEQTPQCGYGACAKCNCQGFEGGAGTCGNGGCGHAYGDHW